MAIDLSRLSDSDLDALEQNDFSKISNEGLDILENATFVESVPVEEPITNKRTKQSRAFMQNRASVDPTKRGSQREDSDDLGFMPFLNRSLAQIAGSPVDVTNALLQSIGLGSEQPFGGSQSIRAGMEAIGAPTPDRDPETFAETAGTVAGEIAAFSAPVSATALALSKGSGTVANISKTLINDLINRPVRTAATEAALVSPIALARQAGESGDLGPTQQILAETAAGVLPATAVQTASKFTLGNLGLKAIAPFTQAGAKARAARRVQTLAEDPLDAARRIEDLRGTDLLPAARSEDPGLMALEETVIRETPQQSSQMSTKRSDIMNDLSNTIIKSGNAASTQDFFKLRAERLNLAMQARIEKATEEAADALRILGDENLSPTEVRQSSNQIVRDALERALDDAKKQQDELWKAIPQSARGPVKNTIQTYKDIVSRTASAQIGDIPDSAKRIIGPSARRKGRGRVTRTTVRELDGLYKKLGEEARDARASGFFNEARIAEDLREAILNDLGSFTSDEVFVSEAIDAARTFSRQMNEKFNRGPVGKILAFSREGGEKIATELTISTILQPGVKATIGFEALKKATDDPLAFEAISNFLKSKFFSQVVDPTTGRIRNQSSVDTFLRQNEDILDLVPTVKAQLTTARDADDALRLITNRSDALRKSLDNPKISSFASIINQPADVAINQVFNNVDPQSAMQRLINAARKDKLGQASDGLKSSVSEYLINRITTGRLDSQGRPVLNGLELQRLLKDTKVSKTLSLIFNPQELSELSNVAKQMSSLQLQSQINPLTRISDDRAGFIVEKIAQIIGAKIGAKLSSTSGGSIQSASIGSTVARKWLNNLTSRTAKQLLIDAVRDPELMVTLLQHRTANKANERVIRNYMISPLGSRLVDPELLEEAKEEAKAFAGSPKSKKIGQQRGRGTR
tara:strand:+ start:2347 stop:5118 length:2772 start_codon:yes stop_codon:yes gene_type:complete